MELEVVVVGGWHLINRFGWWLFVIPFKVKGESDRLRERETESLTRWVD